MAKHWSKEEQNPLLESIISYRELIKDVHDTDIKEAKRLTLDLAKQIHTKNSIVQNRTDNAIYERLPYLDNLLGGVFEKEHYAKKDQHLFATKPRANNQKEPNLCNTRHKYNGAMPAYLKLKNSKVEI
jgi:hypothetical protein